MDKYRGYIEPSSGSINPQHCSNEEPSSPIGHRNRHKSSPDFSKINISSNLEIDEKSAANLDKRLEATFKPNYK